MPQLVIGVASVAFIASNAGLLLSVSAAMIAGGCILSLIEYNQN